MGSCFSRNHDENSHWLQLPTEQGPCTAFGHKIFLETIYQILQRVHKYFLFLYFLCSDIYSTTSDMLLNWFFEIYITVSWKSYAF